MSKTEFISPEGFRIDGRRINELRSVQCRMDCISAAADGSAYFEMGNTSVLSYVYGPCELKKRRDKPDKGKIICSVTIAPYSTADRKVRSKYDRLTQEYALTVCESFDSLVSLDRSGQSQIYIFVYVLQMDGGVRNAIINACCLALADAGIPLKELMASCAATLIDGRILTDPNSGELNAGGAELSIALHGNSKEVGALELNSKLSIEDLKEMYGACSAGCKELLDIMKAVIREKSIFRYKGMALKKR